MELSLNRNTFTDKSTIGVLNINGADVCNILEDTDRHLETNPSAKVYGQTCIPRGRYQIVVTYSPHFARNLPLLQDVPGYEGVRIHPGNTPADTDGCLLPGRASGIDFVAGSVAAFDIVFQMIEQSLNAGEEVWITIS